MQLEQGDMQLVNNEVIVHSRTPFEDHAEADRKRHLLRRWLAVPGSQPLPADGAKSGLGRLSSCRPGCTTAARSAAKCGEPNRLTRTIRVLPVAMAAAAAGVASMACTALRASALRAGLTASSRSNDKASASPAKALENSSGRVPGTNNLLRMGPGVAGLRCQKEPRSVGSDTRESCFVETNYLRTFVWVVEAGSMLEAARRLDITPTAVAQQLRVL